MSTMFFVACVTLAGTLGAALAVAIIAAFAARADADARINRRLGP